MVAQFLRLKLRLLANIFRRSTWQVVGIVVGLIYGLGLAVLLFLSLVGTAGGLRTGPPTVFVVLAWVSFVLEVAIVVFLWHPDTNAYLRGEPVDGAVLTD